MTDKVVKKQTADESVDVSRRRVIKGAAAGAVAGTGIITGFPYVHASEPITLRYMATGVSQHSQIAAKAKEDLGITCLLYTSPSPRDGLLSRMPSSA